jgi:hypothetical protein
MNLEDMSIASPQARELHTTWFNITSSSLVPGLAAQHPQPDRGMIKNSQENEKNLWAI